MIRRPRVASLIALAIAFSSARRAPAQHVWVVDPAGPYTQIQPAVDAAATGDTVLVHTGNYGGFTINHKGVAVVAAIGASVHVSDRVRVDNLASDQSVLLAGLYIQPTGAQPTGVPAFGAQNDAGALRVELCTISGTAQPCTGTLAQIGVDLESDADAAFANCTLNGARGADGGGYSWFGTPGGFALSTRLSQVAMWDCILRGGDGGNGVATSCGVCDAGSGARGGSGCRVTNGYLFVANSQLYGGDGGNGGDSGGCCYLCGGCPGSGASGGDGILVIQAAPPFPAVEAVADLLLPGNGGHPGHNYTYCCNGGGTGAQGLPISAPAGSVSETQAPVRILLAPRVVHETTSVSLDFHGVPGDQVSTYLAAGPEFVRNATFHGVNLTQTPPSARVLIFGTIPASGVLHAQFAFPDYGVDSKVLYMQSVFSTAGARHYLSGPTTMVVLDSAF